MNTYYFDYAAATPLDASVELAMRPFGQELFYNPSSLYLAGIEAKKRLEAARARVASHLGTSPATVTFTAGVTEANNIFIQGVARTYPQSHMIISAIEHESIHGVMEQLQHIGQIEFDVAPVDANGRITIDGLTALIKPNTVLLSIIHIHNEFGTIQDLPAIATLKKTIEQQRKADSNTMPLLLHTDAAQSPNYVPMAVDKLGVDAISISAAKLYGPKQVGALYVRRGVQASGLLAGGGQEHGLRPGTQNVAGAVGLATALDIAQKMHSSERSRLSELQTQLETSLASLPRANLHAVSSYRVPAFVSVDFGDHDGERLVMELDERGIQLGTGSACNAGSGEPSQSLLALGLSHQQAKSTIRISMGRFTEVTHIEYLVNSLRDILG